MKTVTFRNVLGKFCSFLLFFLTVGFVVSCCMMLFLNVLSETSGVEFTADNITVAAKITFINVLIITLLYEAADLIRRKIMVDKPVKMITDTTAKIMNGDFNARVDKINGSGMEGFNQIGETINSMAEELSSVETLRTDFIANVSHEIKTPLSVMQNYARLLEQPNLSEEKRIEYAKAIDGASRRLATLVSNILKLNKLENQKITAKFEKYDLSEQLCECLLQFEDLWEKKNIEINADIDDNILISSDKEMMSIVWNNLISNAIKFTDEGGTVTVSVKESANHATVTVSDTGCGMSSNVGKHIFDKFYQADTSRVTEGNGLGLALVKRVVDITKSEISVQSREGEGTVFTIRMRKNING